MNQKYKELQDLFQLGGMEHIYNLEEKFEELLNTLGLAAKMQE